MTEAKKDLTVQEKKEIKTQQEATIAGRRYLPATDIVETDGELMMYLDMPGVKRDQVNIRLEKNVLFIEGAIDSKPYEALRPLYTEYNIGHFTRRFELSSFIDQAGIKAAMADGVLQLTLPKVPEQQPKLIAVN
jgi:HSP20 family protein